MSAKAAAEILSVDGQEVRVTNPGKVYFPDAGVTKLDLVNYYLAVADGALRAIGRRPLVLKRYVDGITGEGFFQKRAPAKRPDWVQTVELSFPSGRTAHELVVTERAQLVWITNLGNIDLHAHPVRADDLDHPDELRVDLDPGPGVSWQTVRDMALLVREVLAEHGLVGWPKTTGSRGLHVYVRIRQQWGFAEVRRAALAVSREVERRAPGLATSKWWKEERVGVFLDYNQNAKDRTIAAAYSVRPLPDARVSAPLAWEEVPDCEPADFTLHTMPARLAARGDLAAGMDAAAGSLDGLLELAARHEAEGPGWRCAVAAPLPPPARRTAPGGAVSRPRFPERQCRRPAPTGQVPRRRQQRSRPPRRRSRRTRPLPRTPRRIAGRTPVARAQPRPAGAAPPCRWWWSPRHAPRRTRVPAWSAGGGATRGRLRTCRPPTCWWMPCAVAPPPGPGYGSTCAMFRRRSGRPRKRPIPTTIRGGTGLRDEPGTDLPRRRAWRAGA